MRTMNTLDELREQILATNWFARVGHFTPCESYRAIETLEPPQETEDDWDWLPTTSTQDDPIHQPSLKEIAHSQGRDKELASKIHEFYKLALVSLRKADDTNSLFHVGVHNLFPAAKGAALFAVRMAVAEIVTENQGFWCCVVSLYCEGFYPCGYSLSEVIVL